MPDHSQTKQATGHHLKHRDGRQLQKAIGNSWQEMTAITSTKQRATMNSTTMVVAAAIPNQLSKVASESALKLHNNFRLVTNLHALVRRIAKPSHQNWTGKRVAVILMAILVVNTTISLPNYQLSLRAEAKIHHSKRQVPQPTGVQQSTGGSSSIPSSTSASVTGRESTNWWNIWWQRKFIPSAAESAELSSSLSDYLSNTMASSASEEAPDLIMLRNNRPQQTQKLLLLQPKKSFVSQTNPQPQTEYINEAVQPTVRPIVAVSFNGRTINLSDQNSEFASQSNNVIQYQGSNGGGENPRDTDSNLVFGPNQQQHSATAAVDFERNERLPLEDNTNVFVDKQMLLAHRKSMQHQMHWQSVKPTLIQPPSPMLARDSRTNRQVNESPLGEPSSLGIQMRATMNTRLPQQQLVMGKQNMRSQSSQRPGYLASPAQNLFQQQQQQPMIQQQQMTIEDNSKFEQQQNQMVDYSEENEPELDEANQSGGGNDDSPSGRTSTDSSSSSMMQEDKAQEPSTQVMPGMRKSMESMGFNQMQGRQEGNRQPTGPRTIIMMGMGPNSIISTANMDSQQMQTRQPTIQQPTTNSSSTVDGGQTNSGDANRDENNLKMEDDSSQTVQTSTRSPSQPMTTTTVAPTFVTTTLKTTNSVDVNETPVTRPTNNGFSPKTMTTPASRVQLENGRPATGFRQQGTTNAARPPTITTPAKAGMVDQAISTTTKTPQAATTLPPRQTTIATLATSTTDGAGTSSSSGTTTQFPSSMSQTTTIASSSPGLSETTTLRPVTLTGVTSPEAPTTTSATSRPETTTLRPVTGAASGNETSEAGDESDDEDGEDEEGGNDQSSGNGKNLMNSSDDSVTGDDEEDEEETTTGQEQPTTVSTPITGIPTSATMTTRQKQQQQSSLSSSTTQPPSMTTIDIERLPKVSTTTTTTTTSSSSNGDTRDSSTVSSTMTTTTPSPMSIAPDDIARIQINSGNQDGSANIVMMTIGQSNRPIDEEMAITMPMEALMKMMNQVVQDNERLQAGSSPMSGLVANETPSTTPTAMTTTTTTTTTTSEQEAFTERPGSMVPSTTVPSSMVSVSEDENLMVDRNTQDQMNPLATKKKLPPPPTPRAGLRQQQQSIQMQTSFIDGGSGVAMGTGMDSSSMTSVSDSATPPQKAVMVGLEPVSVSSGDDMISGGREPKIELLNLDLMPIQRIMSNQMAPMSSQTPGGNRFFERERLMQQQQQQQPNRNQLTQQQNTEGSMLSNGSTRIPFDSENQSNQMEQIVIAEVEPGMRLRPPMGGSFVNQQQQQRQQQLNRGNSPIIMSDTMNNKNQANTVYMIMMNNPSTEIAQTRMTQQPAKTTKFGSSVPSRETGSGDNQPMTTMMMQRDQTRTTSLPTTKTAMLQSTSGNTMSPLSPGIQMRTTQAASMVPSTTMTTSGGSSSSLSTKSPTNVSSPSSAMQQQQKQMMMIQMSTMNQVTPSQASTPVASTTTTTEKPTFLDNTVELEIQRQADQRPSQSSGERGGMAVIMRQQSQQAGPTTTTSSTQMTFLPTTSKADQQITTTTSSPSIDPSPETTTTKTFSSQTNQTTTTKDGSVSSTTPILQEERRTTVAAPQQRQQGPTTAATIMADNQQFGVVSNDRSETNNNNLGKLERLKAQPMAGDRRQQQIAGTKKVQTSKVGGSKTNNSTSSFIPNKLRNEFNKIPKPDSRQQEAQASSRQSQILEASPNQTPTTQSPLTGMAIRQFGGANRMSVLGNQPVPFGRPAAMTMQSSQRHTGSKGLELPTFEYGPSIAVRRPDEPLANGQIPNCTLTGKNFCVLTKDYPMNEVRQAVERSFRSVRIMYEELQTVSDQELHKDDFNATNNQAASGKFACQTQVEMMRPGWAKDEITKEWMLVVNTDVFPQRVRTESCAQPNTPCEFIAPFYDSTCQQRYSLHRMIAIDPHDPSRSPQVAVFRFPAGCVCRVHPIRKTTTTSAAASTTSAPTTIISSSTSKSIRRRR